MLTPAAYPLHKISIIPRGIALGVTITTPDSDRVSYSREELNAQIRVALGGRVAEELVFDTITTGADSDLEALTSIAHQMVGRWGMSEAIGPLSLLRADHEELQDNEMFAGGRPLSEGTQSLIDQETKRIVDDAHKDVRELLTKHRTNLESLAQTLLKSETLGALDAYAAAGITGRHDMSLIDLT
jgi:cell division protease FtsH